MKDFLIKVAKKGFFHIFGANVLNKIIQFCSGIFLVRLLSKAEYGNYSYAQNILNMFLLFSGLGVLFALLQFGSEESGNKRKLFYKYGFVIGFSFNILLSVSMVIYAFYFDFPNSQSQIALLIMFLMPLSMFIFEYIQNYLRTGLYNIEFSKIVTMNTFLIFLFSVLGAILFNLYGVIIAYYLAYTISIVTGYLIIRRKDRKTKIGNYNISSKEKKEFMSYSVISMSNNVVSQMLYLIDIFLIGLLIKDTSIVATYKTATLIPFALNFVPLSVMTFIYPYFAKNRENKQWVKVNYKKLQNILMISNFCIVIVLIIGAPLIINILFGSNYSDSITLFRILCIGYFIAGTFRIPAGNVLAMLRKVNFLFIANLIMAIVNICLNIVLIQQYSAIGAAISTVTIIALSSIVYNMYLKKSINKKY